MRRLGYSESVTETLFKSGPERPGRVYEMKKINSGITLERNTPTFLPYQGEGFFVSFLGVKNER
jgi:hypothetical protein